MRFFFYGTLLDEAVRRRVLGGATRRVTMTPAVLDGWIRYFRRGIPYRMIRPHAGSAVEGAVAAGIDREAARLLDAYEGELYRRRRVFVSCKGARLAALVYVPRSTE